MCAAAVAIDRFSAFGATAQPANSSVKNATTVRLTAPPLSILFFMNPFICLIRPAQHRVYSTPSEKKGLIDQNPPGHEPPPASQDRARIICDCRMTDDPGRDVINDCISCNRENGADHATIYGALRRSAVVFPTTAHNQEPQRGIGPRAVLSLSVMESSCLQRGPNHLCIRRGGD